MRIYLFNLFLISCLFFFGCERKKKEIDTGPVEVTSYLVEPKNIPAVFEFVGFVESSHPVEIRARVEGYLDTIAYKEGQVVQKGDLLFQLDPRQYQAEVERAKAEVSRQEAILTNANLTVNRLKPLYEQKATSKKDLDTAVSNQLATEASLQAAKAQLLNAEINLDYTTIRSPITGLAAKANLREGALINPATNSLLTTVSAIDPIWINFTVSDNDILKVTKQSKTKSLTVPQENEFIIEAIMSDGSVYPYKGKVDYSSPTYDQSTGTMLVRGIFPNPNGDLRPGQFIRVKVYGATRPNAIIIPRRALMQKKSGLFVYLIENSNSVIAQDVQAAEWFEDYQIITNGLKTGDKIVVDGINKINSGSTIKVIGRWKSDSLKPGKTS